MTHRDQNGHFISDVEWARMHPEEGRGDTPEVGHMENPDGEDFDEEDAPEAPSPTGFGVEARNMEGGTVFVDTGRGNTTEVAIGSPFVSTLERLANEAHYGGYFRIFLNGREVVNPEDSPANIEKGMRIAITSYDKVG
jgi:hypothetical protein